MFTFILKSYTSYIHLIKLVTIGYGAVRTEKAVKEVRVRLFTEHFLFLNKVKMLSIQQCKQIFKKYIASKYQS